MAKTKIKKSYKASDLEVRTKHILMNKFYDLFMNSIRLNGLEHKEEDYVLRKLWATGTIACFNMDNVGPVYCPYSVINYGLYDVPSNIQFINERNVPGFKLQGINEVDCCIGFANRSHKPVKDTISYYVDKMTDILMAIWVNTQTSKLPFIATVNSGNIDAVNEVITNIYNNELAVFLNTDIADSFNVSSTGNYIIDRLWVQYQNYLGEALTVLGIDNNCINFNRASADQTNANNELINIENDGRIYEIQAFFDQVNSLFGSAVTVETKHIKVDSIHDEVKDEVEEDD